MWRTCAAPCERSSPRRPLPDEVRHRDPPEDRAGGPPPLAAVMTTAIIQARMSSTRLPGKVLLALAGEPMLARVVERTRRARTIDRVIVATTVESEDEPIAELCRSRGWTVSRGGRDDVLDRYYQAAVADGA